MATSPTLTPPPSAGMQDASPTTPAAASPSPPQPSPAIQQGTQMAINVVSGLRAIAKAFPAAAPEISEINNIMRRVMAKMMSEGQPGEPQAPPV